MSDGADLAEGVRNMLVDCGGMAAGDSLLIVAEPANDYYDPALSPAVAAAAARLDIEATVRETPFNPVVTDPSEALSAAMDAVDRVLFLARLGDQLRFRPSMAGGRAIMSYALDREMLASSFGTTPYAAMKALKEVVDDAFSTADEVHVTCPAGTDFRGPAARFPSEGGDTTVRRFPLSVFTPIPPIGYAGVIAQVGFLCATGSQAYEPPACEINDVLKIQFDGHWITGFSGSDDDVARAEAHYDHVSGLFGLERNYIHSFHGGIHPGLSYRRSASTDFDRWGNGAFGNPRLLHFHTCGRHAPGEISLNIVDPTVRLDGVALWEAGRLHPQRFPGGERLLGSEPALAALLAAPARDIGLGAQGRLSFRD